MMIITIVDCNEKNLINAHAIDARWLGLFHFSLVKLLCVLPSTGDAVCGNDKVSNFSNHKKIQKTLNDGWVDVIKTLAGFEELFFLFVSKWTRNVH